MKFEVLGVRFWFYSRSYELFGEVERVCILETFCWGGGEVSSFVFGEERVSTFRVMWCFRK